jgi:uncharacterized protein
MRLRWEADRQLRHFSIAEFTEIRRAIDRRALVSSLSTEDLRWLITAAIYDGFIPTSVLPAPDDPMILEPAAYWLRRRSPRGPRYRSAFLLERCTRPERDEVTFAGLIVPFGSVIGPLAVWLTRRDQDPFIDQAGREALNFGISIAIYGSVLLVAALMLVGIPLLMVGVIAWVVLASLAAVKASQGEAYRYPLTMRFVR